MAFPRTAAQTVRDLAKGYPVVMITGPRQSGKTTLARMVWPDKPYVSLEDLDQREFASGDPKGFLATYRDGAILDEAQHCPEIFSYLQRCVDEDGRMGLFLITGSQRFGMFSEITQSLAGRAAMLSLLPFSLAELKGGNCLPETPDELLFKGLYPPIYDRELDPNIWYGNYVRTYVERDVRRMLNIRDLSSFQRFVRLCASRTGKLLNLSNLANECGISHNTVRSWISVMEANFLVHLLEPHYRNFKKRLVKSPKVYFVDPGLAAWLLGIQTIDQLSIHPHRGALFESWVVSELLKMRYNQGLTSNLYFWRDKSGHEIDVLIDNASGLVPVEIKSGQTVTRHFFRNMDYWRGLAGEDASKGMLIYAGKDLQNRSQYDVIPWDKMDSMGIGS